MADVTVNVRPNGPLIIEGPITMLDPEGNAFKLEGERHVLCRCGQSSKKPFCDATHRTCGFESVVSATA
jgi:CDGSH-type Zn-finger protein